MQRVTYCLACGVPLVKQEDFGGNDPDNRYCVNCTDENGKLREEDNVRRGIRAFWSSRGQTNDSSRELWPDRMVGQMARLRK